MKRRAVLMAAIVLALYSAGCTRIAGRVLGVGPVENRVVVETGVMVPMSDGVRLATDIYKPKGMDRGPVVLIRTPYNKSGEEIMTYAYKIICRQGYFVAVQDCRGKFGSEGEFYPFLNEADDGKDMVAWLNGQTWCDGNIGTWGGSYFGYTQWSLADDNPYLDAMVPYVTTARIEKIIYEGGALNYQNILGWSASNSEERDRDSRGDMKEAVWNLPLDQSDDIAAGANVPMYEDVVNYAMLDVMKERDFSDNFDDVSAPSYNVVGWYDLFQKYQIEDFMFIREEAHEPARSMSRIVVGPWGHGVFKKPPVKYKEGGILQLPQFGRMMDFYDHLLKGMDNGVDQWAPWRIYVMGVNEWREFEEWPPEDMELTSFYFQSGGDANTAAGDGVIMRETRKGGSVDEFVYDPADPVPTVGGPLLAKNLGPAEQSAVESREDVLVYTGEELSGPLTVMGPIKVVVYAASDATDTDFTAKLCDVFHNGKSINIADGIVRARFHNGDLDSPELIEPGKVYEYEIDLWYTAYVFQPGHRVRVQISSSNFPRFDRNLNTGGDIASGTEMREARQKIFHDSERPSRIILPVVE